MLEETRDSIIKVFNFFKKVAHFGYIPLILYLGKDDHPPLFFNLLPKAHLTLIPCPGGFEYFFLGYTASTPRPSLFKLISPLAV